MLRFSTGGESHGEALLGILENFPANLTIDYDFINWKLKERQRGYGRGKRMLLENDKVQFLSGIRNGKTTGNPISIYLENKGNNIEQTEVKRPRPGHVDLPGALKFNQEGGRNPLERASARETAMRVAIGSICNLLLKELGMNIYSHVIQIGSVKSKYNYYNSGQLDYKDLCSSEMKVICEEDELDMIREIRKAREEGDTVGGVIETIVENVPIGLGSYTSWDRKLDANISRAVMSIPAIKGIDFGIGFWGADKKGSQYHDEIYYDNGFKRYTNNAGGLEGGVSNGEDIVIRTVMKPIPTLRKPLRSINIDSKEVELAQFERSDVSAVPSASIVVEAMLAYVLAQEVLIKFGGDSVEEVKVNYKNYLESIKKR